MAKIEWSEEAKQAFRAYVENARLEFGVSTARQWQTERKSLEWNLKRYPTSFTPEALLQERKLLYRRCHLMNRRFKLIYFYDEQNDTVRIVDIWDSKMNPKALVRRIEKSE